MLNERVPVRDSLRLLSGATDSIDMFIVIVALVSIYGTVRWLLRVFR